MLNYHCRFSKMSNITESPTLAKKLECSSKNYSPNYCVGIPQYHFMDKTTDKDSVIVR